LVSLSDWTSLWAATRLILLPMTGLVLLATAAGAGVLPPTTGTPAPLGKGNGARGIISRERGFVNQNLMTLEIRPLDKWEKQGYSMYVATGVSFAKITAKER
jgi:hypothetical protein